jgi:hypothetical protein
MPTLDHDGERLSVDLVYLHMDMRMRDKKNACWSLFLTFAFSL